MVSAIIVFNLFALNVLASYGVNYDGVILVGNDANYGVGSIEWAFVREATHVQEDYAQAYEDTLVDFFSSSYYEEWGEYYVVLAEHSDNGRECSALYYYQIDSPNALYMIGDKTSSLSKKDGAYSYNTSDYKDENGYNYRDRFGMTWVLWTLDENMSIRCASWSFSESTGGTCNRNFGEIYNGTYSVNDNGIYTSYLGMYNYTLVSTNIPVLNATDLCRHLYDVNQYDEKHLCDGGSRSCFIGSNTDYMIDAVPNAPVYLFNKVWFDGQASGTGASYDASQIYLDNFRMITHFSNDYDHVYFEFKYDISEYLWNNQDTAVFDVSVRYENELDIGSGLATMPYECNCEYVIKLSENTDGYKVYLKDIPCMQDAVNVFGIDNCSLAKNVIVGDELFIDFDSIDTPIDAEGLAGISSSDIYFQITPRINQTYGNRNDSHADLLNKQTDYYQSTPTEDGDYIPDSIPTVAPTNNYTYITTDGNGNPIYNYYTINIDGITTPVNGDSTLGIAFTEPLQVYVNGSLGGGGSSSSSSSTDDDDVNLTIEDDDYTDSALREDLKDGFGLLDDINTPEDGDGYIHMALSFFDGLDSDIEDIIGFGISSVITIAILRSILRR